MVLRRQKRKDSSWRNCTAFKNPFQQYAQFKRLLSSKSLDLMRFRICTRLSFESYPSVPMTSFEKEEKNKYRQISIMIFFKYQKLGLKYSFQFEIFQMKKCYYLRCLVTKLLCTYVYKTNRYYYLTPQPVTSPSSPNVNS